MKTVQQRHNYRNGAINSIALRAMSPEASTCESSLSLADVPSYTLHSTPSSIPDHLSKSENDYSDVSLYHTLKPMLFSMKICGLHYIKVRQSPKDVEDYDIVGNGRLKGRRQVLPNWHKAYCWTLVALQLAQIARTLPLLRLAPTLGPFVAFHVATLSWYALCITNTISCLWASEQKSCFMKLFTRWEALREFGGALSSHAELRRRATICCIVCWTLVIVNTSVMAYMSGGTKLMDLIIVDPFSLNNQFAYAAMKVLFPACGFFFSAGWIFPTGFELLLCIIIYKEFRHFKKRFRQRISKAGAFSGNLEVSLAHCLIIINLFIIACIYFSREPVNLKVRLQS